VVKARTAFRGFLHFIVEDVEATKEFIPKIEVLKLIEEMEVIRP